MEGICFITNKYPNPIEPNVLVFVQQLVWSIADRGIKCIVICPMPININPKYMRFPFKTTEKTENGSTIDIYLPKYIGLGQGDLFGFNPARITTNSFTSAVDKVVRRMSKKPDIVYGHFVTPAGIAAARIGRRFNIPAFMAHGEATLNTIKHFGYKNVAKELSSLSGVIAVSKHNKELLVSANAVKEDMVQVFPNGYREERFFPRGKAESRNRFNLPQDKFIVSFVGSFDHRKGIQRLLRSIETLDDVYVICAGTGNDVPGGKKCLFRDSVKNEELPWFYSAADIFVLPTLNEGCCNAIVEAMACGLPIVSSDLSFNDELLDETNSIRIDPLNQNEITKAIMQLRDDDVLRHTLGEGSLDKAKGLTLQNRADTIIKYLQGTQ